MGDRGTQLAADGFVRRVIVPSALAHWAWDVELVVEADRPLRLTDETILRLVLAGIADPDRIAALMGLDEASIVASAAANLMRLGAVRHEAGRIVMTPGGTAALGRATLREPARERTRLHVDPYRHRIEPMDDHNDFLSPWAARDRGLHPLPRPLQPGRRELLAHHLELQATLDERARSAGAKTALELVRVVPVGDPDVMFQEIDLDIWCRPRDGAWAWRVLDDGFDDDVMAGVLRTLEEGGGDVLPLVRLPEDDDFGELDGRLTEVFDAAEPTASVAPLDALHGAHEVQLVLPILPFRLASLDLVLGLDSGISEAAVNPGAGSRFRIALCDWPGEGGPQRMDPVAGAVDHLRERHRAGVIRAHHATRHGACWSSERAFALRYHVDEVPRRDGRGIAWYEYREVAPSALDAIFRTIPASETR